MSQPLSIRQANDKFGKAMIQERRPRLERGRTSGNVDLHQHIVGQIQLMVAAKLLIDRVQIWRNDRLDQLLRWPHPAATPGADLLCFAKHVAAECYVPFTYR